MEEEYFGGQREILGGTLNWGGSFHLRTPCLPSCIRIYEYFNIAFTKTLLYQIKLNSYINYNTKE